MQATYILKSSTIVVGAAYAGEEEKDICHEAEVAAAAALFYHLVVESFGFCTPICTYVCMYVCVCVCVCMCNVCMMYAWKTKQIITKIVC